MDPGTMHARIETNNTHRQTNEHQYELEEHHSKTKGGAAAQDS